ncbi:hypothetical protein N779_14305 [Vibrio coralliilyticus OCN008]|nr:hypothetical protein N779_14305 [Vibrio coralliilyticus OCN008]
MLHDADELEQVSLNLLFQAKFDRLVFAKFDMIHSAI